MTTRFNTGDLVQWLPVSRNAKLNRGIRTGLVICAIPEFGDPITKLAEVLREVHYGGVVFDPPQLQQRLLVFQPTWIKFQSWLPVVGESYVVMSTDDEERQSPNRGCSQAVWLRNKQARETELAPEGTEIPFLEHSLYLTRSRRA